MKLANVSKPVITNTTGGRFKVKCADRLIYVNSVGPAVLVRGNVLDVDGCPGEPVAARQVHWRIGVAIFE